MEDDLVPETVQKGIQIRNSNDGGIRDEFVKVGNVLVKDGAVGVIITELKRRRTEENVANDSESIESVEEYGEGLKNCGSWTSGPPSHITCLSWNCRGLGNLASV